MGVYGNIDGILTLTNDPLVDFNIRAKKIEESEKADDLKEVNNEEPGEKETS